MSVADAIAAFEAANTTYTNDSTALAALNAKVAALAPTVATDATTLNAAIDAAVAALQALKIAETAPAAS